MYHNTTHLTALELFDAIAKAERQEEAVLALYRHHRRLSPSQCWRKYGRDLAPLTSIRRCVSDLAKAGVLVHTGEQVRGEYGKPEGVWAVAESAEARAA